MATNIAVEVTDGANRNGVSAIKLEPSIRAGRRVLITRWTLNGARTLGAAHPVEAAVVLVHVEEGGGVDLAMEGGTIRHLAAVVSNSWLSTGGPVVRLASIREGVKILNPIRCRGTPHPFFDRG